MCSRGVFQLKRLSLFFCDWGGSSRGVRSLLSSPNFQSFRNTNPHIDFQYILKRNHHPYFSSLYINGYIKDIPLRNLTQEQILEHFDLCNKSFGRKAIEASGKRVIGVKESIQGKWYPNMWGTYPRAEMEDLHYIPEPVLPTVKKPLRDPNKGRDRPVHYYDILNQKEKRDGEYEGP